MARLNRSRINIRELQVNPLPSSDERSQLELRASGAGASIGMSVEEALDLAGKLVAVAGHYDRDAAIAALGVCIDQLMRQEAQP